MRDSSLGLTLCLFSIGCGGVVDPEASTARVRVAHLSPDAPAIDFCLAAHDTGAFEGPVLAGAGAPLGLEYANLTKYLDVEAIRYDVRLVAPGSADCTRPLVPDLVELPELPAGASATLAATGKLDHGTGEPFALRVYVDDTEVAADQAKLRFIHASPGTPPVDVGLGGGVVFTPVFETIPYGATRAHDNGYVTTAPFAGAELSARATGTIDDVLAIKPAALPAGAIATAFAIGELGSTRAPLGVLLCNDNGPPHAIKTECKLAGSTPERARLRIAHLSPDAPAVDVCLAPAGSGRYGAPVLGALGARSGLSYPQVTAYVPVPAGSYDVRVVLASETTCANAAVADTTAVAVARDLTATVAAIGVLDRSGAAAHDPGFRLKVFADATSTGAGKAKLRFIHASPGTPAVDVGLGAAHTFVKVFANVSFGNIGISSALDTAGFIETAPFQSAVSARLAGATTDALTVPLVSLDAGAIATAFAIGNKTGSAINPLRVLLCSDLKPAGLLTTCTTAP